MTSYLYYGLIVIFSLCIFIILLIFIIYLKIYHSSIIKYLLLPSPVFGFRITRLLNQILNDPLLDGVLQLRMTIENRFKNFNDIPMIVVFNSEVFNVDNYIINYDTNYIKWSVTSKLAIIYINDSLVSETLGLLVDIFHGRAFNAILYNLPLLEVTLDTSRQIRQTIELIYNISGLKTPVFINLSCILDNLAIESAVIGFEVGQDFNSIMININKFIHYILDLILGNNIDLKPNLDTLSFLTQNKNTVGCFLNDLLNSQMNIEFCSFSSKNNKNQVIFVEDLMNHRIYNSCNKIEVVNIKTFAKRNKIINTLTLISTVFAGLFGGLMIYNKVKYYQSLKDAIITIKEITKSQNQIHNLDQNAYNNQKKIFESNISKEDNMKLLNALKILNNFKPGFLAARFTKDLQAIIQALKTTVMSNNDNFLELLDPVHEQSFGYSPTETYTFRTIVKNIDILKQTLLSMPESPKRKNMEEKITEYIVTIFMKFFNMFHMYELSTHLQHIHTLLQALTGKNINIHHIMDLNYSAVELKLMCKASVNKWWIKKALGNEYKQLLTDIKHLPNIGESLYSHINYMEEMAFLDIGEKILGEEHFLCGKILNIQEDRLDFSVGFQSLLDKLTAALQESLVTLNNPIRNPLTANVHEICIWDLDLLEQILITLNKRSIFINSINSYTNGTKNVLINLVDNNLRDYINTNLVDAQILSPISLPMEQKAANINQAHDKLLKILSFAKLTLETPINWVINVQKDNYFKIYNDVLTVLNSSMFMNYNKLNEWNGEDLIQFLFQCNVESLPFYISKTIKELKILKEQILLPMLDKIIIYSKEKYEFIKYIYDQITAYENGANNHIAAFETFVLGLKDWKFMWRESNVNLPSNEQWFRYYTAVMQNVLINKTNDFVFEVSKAAYNNLVIFFNKYLAGKFPFGNTINNAEIQNIITFLNLYRQIRPAIIQDKTFMNLPQAKTIEQLDAMNELFNIEGNNMFMDIQMKCHYETEHSYNTGLIIEYINQFGDIVKNTDNINLKYNIKNVYALEIRMANSSSLHIAKSTTGKTTNNSIRFEFFDFFGFLRFVDTFRFKQSKKNALLKITIPLVNKDNKNKTDNITAFVKVFNVPIFLTKLEPI